MRRNLQPATLERLDRAVQASKRVSSVALPTEFVRDQVSEEPLPPLTRLLRGGGEVRLKVLLTTLMIATRAPHSTEVEAADLADLLQLGQDKAAIRRVNDAFKSLEKFDLVQRLPRRGLCPTTIVLNPSGDGRQWDATALTRPYLTLPIDLWTHGWVVWLSARELGLLLVLLDLTSSRRENPSYADGIRKREYGLGEDTWTRATKELIAQGLLETTTEIVRVGRQRRRRTGYILHLERLKSPPQR